MDKYRQQQLSWRVSVQAAAGFLLPDGGGLSYIKMYWMKHSQNYS
jgi:hypothetical protein